MQSIEELSTRFALPGLTFIARGEGFPVVEVENAHCSASVALQGAHLMTWIPRGQPPVIWLSGDAKLATGKSIRGGVPVCWPWFGPHQDSAKPAHGHARTAPWRLVDAQAQEDGATRLGFELIDSDAARAFWPHDTPVRLELTIGATLAVDLVTRNAGGEPIAIGEALHTYFQVSDIAKVEIQGLSGTTYLDKVGAAARKTQQGAITIGSEVDRIYVATEATCEIVDRGYGRRISIEKSGSRSTVVWNPWKEKADKMGDLGVDGFRHMVCVESGNALEDCVTIAPGASHALRVVYSVAPL